MVHWSFMALLMASLVSTSRAWAPKITRAQTFYRRRPLSAHANLLSVDECLKLADTARFVDGTWFHKGNRNGRDEYEQGPRIRGSVYFDLVDIAARGDLFPDLNPQKLPAMLPPTSLLNAAMDALEIDKDDQVIVYGREGTRFLPRIWFTLRTMGHERVSIMQGSMEEWAAAGGPMEDHPERSLRAEDLDWTQPTRYQARKAQNVTDLPTMIDLVQSSSAIVIDARGSSFAKGHMPGAVHLPYSSLVEEGSTIGFQSIDGLRDLFLQAGVDPHTPEPIVCTCGSGVSACSLYLALQELGRQGPTSVYDGSWSEWKQQADLPKEVPAERQNGQL